MSGDDVRPLLRPRRRWIWLVGIAIVLTAVAAGLWRRATPEHARAAQSNAPPAVQVTVATAARHDVPIYLSGLGTVQASITVSIHAQVDGTLQEVPFAEGQQVHKGDVLARIDPRLFQAALDQAKAKKAQDEAQLIAADKDLTRFTTLGDKGFETQQNIDQQQAKVDQLKGSIEADVAAIESAQTQLDYTTIVAPSDGRMGVRLVDPGNIVHAADQTAIATLTQTRPIAVLFTLPSRSLDDVRDAMARGPVEVTAFDQDNRAALGTGQLLLVDNVIDQTTATIRLKAMFPNDDERLWPGEFVNARLLLETRHQALTIPSSAVQRGPNGLFAWVVTAGGTAEMHPLRVGPTSGDQAVVVAGLAEGDRVVTDGQYRLQQNAPVAVSVPQPSGAGNAS
jgi:membrane fusion protein, multidrug efflux system